MNMRTVEVVCKGFYEIKNSKFHSFILPYYEFSSYLKKLQAEHKKANHIAWAYRYIDESGLLPIENQSDDGEVKGTAGKPILNVLRGNSLINVALFVVRYFGGIKLGANGLIKAYTNAALVVLNNADIKNFEKLENITLTISFKEQRHFEYILKKFSINNIKREFYQNKIKYVLKVNEKQKSQIISFKKL